MKTTIALLSGVLLTVALTISPADGQQASAEEHAEHHPDQQAQKAGMTGMNMAASNARLDELVKKMNAAQGQAKVDAIAELLTALVQTHKGMHADMSQMMSNMHGGQPPR